jgi:hypothetical protein
VVEANVAYPVDSSLLAKGVARIAATVKKLRAMGLATCTRLIDRTRSARSRARSINANLRRRSDDKLVDVRRINRELAGIADRRCCTERCGGISRPSNPAGTSAIATCAPARRSLDPNPADTVGGQQLDRSAIAGRRVRKALAVDVHAVGVDDSSVSCWSHAERWSSQRA